MPQTAVSAATKTAKQPGEYDFAHAYGNSPGGTPVGNGRGWSSYLLGVKIRDLVSFRVSFFKIIIYCIIIKGTTAFKFAFIV